MAEYVWIDGSNGIRSKSKVSLIPALRFRSPIPTHYSGEAVSCKLDYFKCKRNNWLRCAVTRARDTHNPDDGGLRSIYWGSWSVTPWRQSLPSAGWESLGVPYLYREPLNPTMQVPSACPPTRDVVSHSDYPRHLAFPSPSTSILTWPARHSRRRSSRSTSSQNGTLTVHQRARRPATTPTSTSAPSHTTLTPSVWATTSSSCARRTCRTVRPTHTTSATTRP